MKRIFIFFSLALIMNAGGKGMELKSSAFKHMEKIPSKYTCDGPDISPPLSWSGVPSGTKSLVIIVDDPDAPMGTWVHWLVYNIPPEMEGLPENFPKVRETEQGIRQGITDFGRVGYGGPCPPSGTHRYFFKLYALDTTLNLPPGATKKQLLKAMEGHILAKAELVGLYSRM